jgi:hypothetical protein
MKRIGLLLGVLLYASSLNAGVWDVATPAGTDPQSQGDDRIRELKVAIQEALRGGEADGTEAIFPGHTPSTAPYFHYRGLRGTEAQRPSAVYGGLYYNTTSKTIQRANGSTWENITLSPETSAVYGAVAMSTTSASGVVYLSSTTNSFNVAGTEAVTSIANWSAGVAILKWNSARTLTHNGTTLILKGGYSRSLSAGDISIMEFTAANSVREIGFYGSTDTVSGTMVFKSSAQFDAGVFGNVHNSSQAVRIVDVSWGSAGLVCKSTLTVIGSTFTIIAGVSINSAGAPPVVVAGYLFDGVAPTAFNPSATCSGNKTPWKMSMVSQDDVSFSINARETAAHGSHNICIWACNSQGTTAGGNLDFRVEYN